MTDDRDRREHDTFGRKPTTDDLLDRHLGRTGARQTAREDAVAQLQLSMLRHFLQVMHSALDDEHIDPDVTQPVIERVIYGGALTPFEVEQRLATQRAFTDYIAGDTRPTRINVDPGGDGRRVLGRRLPLHYPARRHTPAQQLPSARGGERNNMIDIDASNEHLVGSQGGGVVILNPPRSRMDRDEALRMAAWIVAMADTSDDHAEFARVLAAVENT